MNEYRLELERPVLRNLKFFKNVWAVIQIVVCGAAAFAFAYARDLNPLVLSSEVFIAAGSLPLLLSFPIYAAKFSVQENDGYWHRIVAMPCFIDTKYGVAFLANVVFIIYGVCVLEFESEDHAVEIELSGIFAEICLIGFVTVICQVPAVSDDETKTFLTQEELDQLERSATLSAPYIPATNLALNLMYERELRWLYPFEFSIKSPFSISRDHVSAMRRTHFNSKSEINVIIADGETSSKTKNQFVRGVNNNIKSVFGDTISVQAHKEMCSEILNGNPSGFDNCFFVSALGHSDLKTLGRELKSSLFACIGGGTSRLIQNSAIISIGNLYFNSKNPKVSQRLFTVWSSSEISTIRNACVVAIKAVNFEPIKQFVQIMNKIQDVKLEDVKKLCMYFDDMHVDSSLIRSSKCPTVQDTLQVLRRSDVNSRLQILISICVQKNDFSYQDINTLASAISKFILFDGYEFHYVQSCALEALRRIVMSCDDTRSKGKTVDLLSEIGNSVYSRSVFRSVRKGAHRLLKVVQYKHLDLYRCFRCTSYYAENGGVTHKTIRNLLQKYLRPNIWKDLLREVEVMSSIESACESFEKLFSSEEHVADTTNLSNDPVLLLYTYMSIDNPTWIPSDTFVMKRMNSPDWLERFTAVIVVMRFESEDLRNMRKVIFPRLAASELISDVRELIEYAISSHSTSETFFLRKFRECIGDSDNVEKDDVEQRSKNEIELMFVKSQHENLKSKVSSSNDSDAEKLVRVFEMEEKDDDDTKVVDHHVDNIAAVDEEKAL